ncbi:AIG2-like family protein [Posidoniimonas polymericola]|uniref:Putative gamma-glutamylcyclotransferase n=1 Tax=Posidoniimonas polymericola TaxID=2528002 RepID=A0A5C5YGE6_9BACT|nr:gamma-glutamylcyclotransferase family protein [Posidoniimonas polymericola]TWT73465.1 AIG2-like family protein [Posidoniimonas polymericola]
MDVFTYGTLQVDAIWRRIAQQPCTTVPGVAEGFRARRVCRADYPAMTEQAGESVAGLVYCGVGEAALRRLDAFEGPQYIRRAIAVACADGQTRRCQAYLLAASRIDELSDEPWTLADFIGSDACQRFTQTYVGFDSCEDS